MSLRLADTVAAFASVVKYCSRAINYRRMEPPQRLPNEPLGDFPISRNFHATFGTQPSPRTHPLEEQSYGMVSLSRDFKGETPIAWSHCDMVVIIEVG